MYFEHQIYQLMLIACVSLFLVCLQNTKVYIICFYVKMHSSNLLACTVNINDLVSKIENTIKVFKAKVDVYYSYPWHCYWSSTNWNTT